MNDTLIFLVLAGLALAFKWLTGLTNREVDVGEPPEPDRPNEQRSPRRTADLGPSEEERVRKFLEALGVPADAPPPPPVRPRTVTPRPVATTPAPTARQPRAPKVRRGWAQPLPPITATPPEPLVIEAVPPPELVIPLALPPTPSLKPIASPARGAARQMPAARALTDGSVRTMLRARGNARRAIVLREVLGPPRGLQSPEDWRGL